MITFLLGSDKNEYSAFDEGLEIGTCSFASEGYDMKIVSLCCDDETVAEGLLRSSMNYCAQKGAYLAHITKDLMRPAAEKLGFSDNNLIVEIPEALTSCSCHKKN